ncbi:uncharacterized protein LOC110831757 isoform X2 [Zootermopsis nevadensis]|uniref:uncharacterized protein LOC110831757 isoform X2 n=1 Tax=Zootermopsis nevadensis TaxID=136037 RepID=UPI000B8E8F00|nr:uncharacterized protein LOC110831757 isoform X2 [Zootermopsis nevadensis]
MYTCVDFCISVSLRLLLQWSNTMNNPVNNMTNNTSGTGGVNNSEQPDPDFIKMFVGQIPRSMDENDLRKMFEEFGRVHQINVLRDKVTGQSKVGTPCRLIGTVNVGWRACGVWRGGVSESSPIHSVTNTCLFRQCSNKQQDFARCCFKHPGSEMPETTDSENDAILEMQHVRNYEEFACINNSFQCYKENEDYRDAIVEQIATKHQNTPDDQEGDEDDAPELERVTTNQNARTFVAGLRSCFMQEGDEGSSISAPDTCADFVQLQPIRRTRQGTLDKFLQHH